MLKILNPLSEKSKGLNVVCLFGIEPIRVGAENKRTVGSIKVANQSHAKVSAYPHAIVKTLIVNVGCDLVVAVTEIVCNIKLIVML